MVWNHRLREWDIAAQNHVAAVLPSEAKANPLERGHNLAPGHARKPAHTATNSASKFSIGTGKPSSSSTAM